MRKDHFPPDEDTQTLYITDITFTSRKNIGRYVDNMEPFGREDGTPILTRAHLMANKAEDARAARKYDSAIEYSRKQVNPTHQILIFHRAAELYLLATNFTSDTEQLSDSLTAKANDMERQLRMLTEQQQKQMNKTNTRRSPVGSPEGRGIDIPSTASPMSNSPNSGYSVSPGSNHGSLGSSPHHESRLEDSQLMYGSHNFFVGQAPAENSHDMLFAYPLKMKKPSDSIATIPLQLNPAEKSIRPSGHSSAPEMEVKGTQQGGNLLTDYMQLDMWGWMEKMLDLLPKPNDRSSHKPSRATHNRQDDLMNSFYFVSGSPTTERNRGNEHDKLMIDDSYRRKDYLELEEENRKLREEVHRLNMEKQALADAYEKGVQASRENDLMKKSIVLFRNELKKKARQLRQSSECGGSVGNLPEMLRRYPGSETGDSHSGSHSTSSLSPSIHQDHLIQTLQSQIKTLTDKNLQQTNTAKSRVIDKWEHRWEATRQSRDK
ncbi:hypothetical protein PROFUN_15410 [Planoprotostelium fungivorum]|uniref:Uncharacterized protein n=1 Tax=Planoprotostelium fungivorum TaxID=1890364 RepID=A0A2P6MVZ9_9EUKA|nr:hypothetical protein PROFUN_15410 [Planoprotostelium fungivorum]